MPKNPWATSPPLTIFEILSPEDRLARLLVRLADFEQMGVQSIYFIDPVDGSCFRFQEGKLTQEQALSVAGKTISVQELSDLLW